MALETKGAASSSQKQRLEKDETSDERMLALARDGDQMAFQVLVKKYEPVVAATVIGMLGSSAEADDVGQETFVRFYKSLHRFRGEAKLGTYLTKIAMNLSLDALRRRKRNRGRFWHQEEQEVLPEELVLDGNQVVDAQARRDMVRKAVQSLDPKHRAVIVLRMFNGYSTKEAASLLGVPVGTVLSRFSRAQDKLKELLKPIMEDESA